MQGKPALVGADIQGLTTRVCCRGRVVLALVEECSCLLSAECTAVKAHAVHGEDSRALVAAENMGRLGRELLQVADSLIRPLPDVLALSELTNGIDYQVFTPGPVPGLGKNLDCRDVVELVDDQTRQ